MRKENACSALWYAEVASHGMQRTGKGDADTLQISSRETVTVVTVARHSVPSVDFCLSPCIGMEPARHGSGRLNPSRHVWLQVKLCLRGSLTRCGLIDGA